MRVRAFRAARVLLALAVSAAVGWPLGGQNLGNTRSAPAEGAPGPASVARLAPRWAVTTSGDVSATPTEAGGTVYAPDWGGSLWAVDAATGAVRWSHSVPDYTGVVGDVSRTSPAVTGDEIVIGDNSQFSLAAAGAFVIGVDRATGAMRWRTLVESHPAAVVTSSPLVFQGVVYVGVSSNEELLATIPGYVCCTFQGSVVALDAATGRLLWKTPTVPAGYSGVAVWGGTPALDPESGLLYVGTGNNYSVPAGVCLKPRQTGCAQPAADDHVDSILALDHRTGAIEWARSTISADVATMICGPTPPPTCGPDFDFGSGPNLFRLPSGRRLLGVGQKSGVYWALDPASGEVVWHTSVGPGGPLGGIEWGTATDGRRIFVPIADSIGAPYTIVSSDGHRTTTSGGSWAALDAATGRIEWQVADPQGAMDLGFVSVANGVVYAGSTAVDGNDMYALDARRGTILWSFASGGSVVSGAAIVRGTVYWGSGYYIGSACPGSPVTVQICAAPAGNNNRLLAFAVPRTD